MSETQITGADKQEPCECLNWCDVDVTHRILTGHHCRCPHGESPYTAALALIADLAKGIEAWGALEDGIPDEVWKPYRLAKGLQGVFLSNERG